MNWLKASLMSHLNSTVAPSRSLLPSSFPLESERTCWLQQWREVVVPVVLHPGIYGLGIYEQDSLVLTTNFYKHRLRPFLQLFTLWKVIQISNLFTAFRNHTTEHLHLSSESRFCVKIQGNSNHTNFTSCFVGIYTLETQAPNTLLLETVSSSASQQATVFPTFTECWALVIEEFSI